MTFKQHLAGWAAIGIALVALLNLPASIRGRIAGGVRDVLAPPAGCIARGFSGRRPTGGGGDAGADARVATDRVGQLLWDLRELRYLEQENAELRRLLGLEARSRHRMIAAQVIDRSLGGWWQMARLDKGLADGLARDLPVVSAEGLVGRIVEASDHTSDVMFLVDPNAKVSARISRLDAFGIVHGQGVSLRGDSLCRMDFIVKEAAPQPGDEVITSGLGGVYPPGLLIGYVEKVYLDRSGLYQYADIVPAADLRMLGFVFVALREPPANDGRESPP